VCEVLADMYSPYAVIIRVTHKEARLYRAGKARDGDVLDGVADAMTQAVLDTGMPLYCNTLNQTEPYRDDPSVQSLGLITYLGGPLRDSTGCVRGALGILDNEKRYYEHVDVELITVAALHLAARLRGEEQEKSNRELADHLRQAQKMEAVGMLAGGIAHDFNNILGGILGFSSYLLSKADPGSTLHRDLKLIEQSAVRAADLTRQLLSFAKRKHFAKEAVNVNGVVREVLNLLRRSLSKHIVIREELEDDVPLVLGDSGQLNQVIMNLCLNAADAMKDREAGRLRVRTECRPLTERECSILGAASGAEYVCMKIGDNGIGMSLKVQEHIFEPFYTTKAHGEGTGLGLSIVYGIVLNHGGHIMVDSKEGKGTTFTVYIPVYRGRELTAAEEPAILLNGTETVLVVDDEAIVRQMVMEVLRGHGYKVVAAESGLEAVHFMDQLRGRVDLVLLDMIMPDMDGEATFTALRRIDPVVPVLLTSGYVKEEKADRLLQRGALGLINKPYKSEALLRRIRQILDARAPRE
jgi:signal transduction histidine kinase/CheY-like chemotaxis protein